VVEFPTDADFSESIRRASKTRRAHEATPHMTRRPPRRAPCLARHYQVTMRAMPTCWPRQTWIATSRRGWVIAAWVLECRARFADSSVRTACDSHR
jgi:hypothetical protein